MSIEKRRLRKINELYSEILTMQSYLKRTNNTLYRNKINILQNTIDEVRKGKYDYEFEKKKSEETEYIKTEIVPSEKRVMYTKNNNRSYEYNTSKPNTSPYIIKREYKHYMRTTLPTKYKDILSRLYNNECIVFNNVYFFGKNVKSKDSKFYKYEFLCDDFNATVTVYENGKECMKFSKNLFMDKKQSYKINDSKHRQGSKRTKKNQR